MTNESNAARSSNADAVALARAEAEGMVHDSAKVSACRPRCVPPPPPQSPPLGQAAVDTVGLVHGRPQLTPWQSLVVSVVVAVLVAIVTLLL